MHGDSKIDLTFAHDSRIGHLPPVAERIKPAINAVKLRIS
jgi:hypothetical protein